MDKNNSILLVPQSSYLACHLSPIMTLDPVLARQNVGLDLDPNYLSL